MGEEDKNLKAQLEACLEEFPRLWKLQEEVRRCAEEFADAFELVFHIESKETLVRLGPDEREFAIPKDGTFLDSKIGTEGHQWASRGSLAAAYQRLRRALEELYDQQLKAAMKCADAPKKLM